nr:SLATT domain-containing protein [Streptomyces sp. HNM0574]
MQPGGPRGRRGGRGWGSGGRRGRDVPHGDGDEQPRGDLLGRTFPLGDWGEPAERLDELYQWVERGALELVDRHWAERARMRRGARVLRGGAAAGVAAGSVLPVLELAGLVGSGVGACGYLALLGAAVCVGGDRYFGLTAGWMRNVATAQAVQRRLTALRYDWATESIREVLGPTEGTAAEAAERCLGVLRRFAEDVSEIVRAETADWMVEFRAGSAPLRTQSAGVRVPRGEECGGSGARFLLPPGTRPNMPGQRRPDWPR